MLAKTKVAIKNGHGKHRTIQRHGKHQTKDTERIQRKHKRRHRKPKKRCNTDSTIKWGLNLDFHKG